MHAFQYNEHFNINITAEVIFLLSLSQIWAEISFFIVHINHKTTQCISKDNSVFLNVLMWVN